MASGCKIDNLSNNQITVMKILSNFVLYNSPDLSVKTIFNVVMKVMNRNEHINNNTIHEFVPEKCDTVFSVDFSFFLIPFYDKFKNYQVRT